MAFLRLKKVLVLYFFVIEVSSYSYDDYDGPVRCLKFAPGSNSLDLYAKKMLYTKPKEFAAGTVDWWLIVKQPDTGGFFYFDSSMEEETLRFYDHYPAFTNFLLNHHRVVSTKNIRAVEYKSARGMMAYDFSAPDPALYDKLVFDGKIKSIGLWFNDQPGQRNGHDAGFYDPQKALEPSAHLKNKKYRWKNAHSKYFIALEIDESKKFNGGFLLDHSLPQVPYLFAKKEQEMRDFLGESGKYAETYNLNGANIEAKAQHAFCFNFGAEEVPGLLSKLAKTLPKAVYSTINYQLFSRVLDESAALLLNSLYVNVDYAFADAKACFNEWKNRRLLVPPLELLTLKLSQCTSEMDFNVAVKMVNHAPTPHASRLPSDKEEDSKVTLLDLELPEGIEIPFGEEMQREILSYNKRERQSARVARNFISRVEAHKPHLRLDDKNIVQLFTELYKQVLRKNHNKQVHATFLGPIPWMMTAVITETILYLSTWTNVDLPSIGSPIGGVLLGDGLTLTSTHHQTNEEYSYQWHRGLSHEKIGISIVENKPWVCIADGNHRTSEISHAGTTFCLSNDKLWKAMTKAYSKNNGADYFPKGQVGKFVALPVGTEKKGRVHLSREETNKRPIFRWHLHDSETAQERNVNGQIIGLADRNLLE